MSLDIATSLEHPSVRIVLGALAVGLLYTLGRELRKIPAKLMVLMATAFLETFKVFSVSAGHQHRVIQTTLRVSQNLGPLRHVRHSRIESIATFAQPVTAARASRG